MTVVVPEYYRGAHVWVRPTYPGMSGDQWFGMWHYTDRMDIVITLEQDYVNRIIQKNAGAILKRTLEHEYKEAKITMERAREILWNKGFDDKMIDDYALENFVGPTPIDWFAQLGGEVHEELQPYNSKADRQFNRDLEKLGYPMLKKMKARLLR